MIQEPISARPEAGADIDRLMEGVRAAKSQRTANDRLLTGRYGDDAGTRRKFPG